MNIPSALRRRVRRVSTEPGSRVRDALIRAMQEMLAEGDVNPAIPTLVERAGVGVGSFYRYFATKDDLIEATVQRTAEEHVAWLTQETAGVTDPIERIAVMFWRVACLAELRPVTARMYSNPASLMLVTPARVQDAQIPTVIAGLEATGLDASEADAVMLVGNGALLTLIAEGVHEGAIDHEKAGRVLVVCLRSIGVPDAQARELAARTRPEGVDHAPHRTASA